MDPAELVLGLAAGEESAWREFIDSYGSLIYAAASKLDLSTTRRDDLFQETCLRAMSSIHTLKDPERLASWVYTIAYRLGVDALRRERPEVIVEDLDVVADERQIEEPEDHPLNQLAHLESVAHLMDAMNALDVRCRNLLSALYLEEPRPSYEEISDRAEMPIGSIGPTRARCLEKVRKLIQNLSNAPSDASA